MRLSDINLLDIGNTIQLVGAVYAGDGKMFICLFPEDHGTVLSEDFKHPVYTPVGSKEEVPVDTLDMNPEDWQTFLRQTDLLETEVTARAKDGTPFKAILRKCQRQIEQGVSWRVYKRDGYACVYCGADDVPLTVDHLVCWEQGGPSTVANLVSSCKRCNRTRGNQSYEDWLASDYYKRVSAGLSPERRATNEALVTTLAAIPRSNYVRSR